MQNRPVIPVSETAGEKTADSVMLLILTLARWRDETASKTIAGRTLGLVGFDQAARAVARRAARGFGMRILVYGADEQATVRQLGAEVSPSLDHLLGRSDFVSLHGRSGDGGAFVNAHRLSQMKPDGCLINAAHGDLMDERDLVNALWFETIGGAGIAVAADTLDRLKDLKACDNAVVLLEASGGQRACAQRPVSFQPTDNVVPLFRGHHLSG